MIAALAGAPAAHADGLEGVWSFSGGAIAVQELPGGSYRGTVVEPTTFAVCRHPVGQVIWTAVSPQPDGSFWGLHQWFHGRNCRPDGPFGLTAWRVLSDATGGRRLEVCFSSPGDRSQPRIAPDGSTADVSYGCAESEPLAPIPGSDPTSQESGIDSFLRLPPAGPCGGRRRLRILLHHVRYDPLAELVVWINGHRVAAAGAKEASKRSFLLKHVPEGAFRLRILAVTVLHQRYWRKRTYRACRHGSGTIKLPKGSAAPHL